MDCFEKIVEAFEPLTIFANGPLNVSHGSGSASAADAFSSMVKKVIQ